MNPDESTEEQTMESIGLGGLTIGEMAVMENLIAAWSAYLELPDYEDHAVAVNAAVHTIQHILAFRVAKRVDPDYWR